MKYLGMVCVFVSVSAFAGDPNQQWNGSSEKLSKIEERHDEALVLWNGTVPKENTRGIASVEEESGPVDESSYFTGASTVK